jgi:hypothetical protein
MPVGMPANLRSKPLSAVKLLYHDMIGWADGERRLPPCSVRIGVRQQSGPSVGQRTTSGPSDRPYLASTMVAATARHRDVQAKASWPVARVSSRMVVVFYVGARTHPLSLSLLTSLFVSWAQFIEGCECV